MSVDLSKAKAGDVVHFRCGGCAEIERWVSESYQLATMPKFVGATYPSNYQTSGKVCPFGESPFDIVKVESK